MGNSYKDWLKVLKNDGFEIEHGGNHDKGIKVDAQTGKIYRVTIKRQGSKEVPKGLHSEMLRQAGLTQKDFEELLKRKKKES